MKIVVSKDAKALGCNAADYIAGLINEAIAMVQPPSDQGKRLKIYYCTQASVKPPTFILFVNNAELAHYSYVRYLENKIRAAFGFKGTPIKFIIREKGDKA